MNNVERAQYRRTRLSKVVQLCLSMHLGNPKIFTETSFGFGLTISKNTPFGKDKEFITVRSRFYRFTLEQKLPPLVFNTALDITENGKSLPLSRLKMISHYISTDTEKEFGIVVRCNE